MYNSKNTFSLNISVWLSVCCIMIFIIIAVGGFTRLTGSGLSIVEWQPIMGIIPPIGDLDWSFVFEKYKQSPEYSKLNFGMSLDEFKFIFMTEYIHRILARLTGIIYLFPMIYFFIKNKFSSLDKSFYIIVLLLFCMQGMIGWYMVKSGLIDNPHVSHFRLTLHLGIGILLYSLLFWKLLCFYPSNKNSKIISTNSFIVFLIYIQILLGAMVAGLKGGMIYNTFPYMNGKFIPDEIYNFSNISEFFNNPAIMQFIHRVNGYFLFIICIYNVVKSKDQLKIALLVLICLFIQIILGILTLVYVVPISFALMHQLWAVVLLSASLVLAKNIKIIK
jgi:cytochrome c oxidase assembly protein subunit 15